MKKADGLNITPYRLEIFNKEIKRIEDIKGIPLSKMQKIKASRIASHAIFPTTKFKGAIGHKIREEFKSEILKTVNVKYYSKIL